MHKPLLLSLLLLSATAGAAEVSLGYGDFYGRLKTVNKGHYQLVELAFSVPKTAGCRLLGGNIATESVQYPLTYTEDQRLFIPFDDALKTERALVKLDIEGDAKDCGIAVQLRTKQTQTDYSQAELIQIRQEMDNLLDAMQGFPMRYFRAPITGLNFEFATEAPVTVTLDGVRTETRGSFQLSLQALNELKSLSFNLIPKVVSPWVQ
ncbi:DUF2987 domain-containing protein [Shewanella sp. AS16]|uniref:DUF2987 domain-containing protein n=1 Tax=Shewanella sp. AS16 TaxID=2907625 RepID=UPI001F38C971|nr:DUF2987 domain-containing protein [Shewanella sp. AS16]MCE9687367.1 DUF2987 domain-containing protein [Shewanella sp. AS16]